MARLKELAAVYAEEDGNIPVEICNAVGQISRGLIQRVDDNNIAVIVTGHGGEIVRAHVTHDRLAGPSLTHVWCLSRSAQVLHNSLTDPAVSQMAEKSMELIPLMWTNIGNYVEAKFALFKEWPGVELSTLIGFIQVSEGGVDRSGFIIYHGKKAPEFVRFLPEKAKLHYFTP